MNRKYVNTLLFWILVITAVSGIWIHVQDFTLMKIVHAFGGILLCVFAGIHIKQVKA